MTGYVRQSAADIVPNEVIKASPLNAEFNSIRDAFSTTIGHQHDGSTAEGAYVPLISSADNFTKAQIDSINKAIRFSVSNGAAAVEQAVLSTNLLEPTTTNLLSIGSSAKKLKDLFVAGTASIGTLSVTGNAIVTGTATLPNAVVTGGTIDGTTVGATTASTVRGTTITATSGLVGNLTGSVTGNVTGNLTGNVAGNVVGNLTGNVVVATGTSEFNDVTIHGNLNMDAGTTATITNLSTPTATGDAATKGYVDTSISNLIASAPGTLDTLNELAAALGDDPNFATTITNSVATKLSLAGGTMTGAIAMGTNKITGLGTPTASADATTKSYVDTGLATKLNLTGGTLSGALAMGGNKITNLGAPTVAGDATNKDYIDTLYGSTASAATSAAAAATSASQAATSETNASTSATDAAASAAAAALSYDSFDDRYLGAKTAGPATDNDGNALITGALYFDTTSNLMKVYDGASWVDAGSAVNGTAERSVYTAASGQTSFSVTYDVGFVDVYLNGVKLVAGTDFTATDGLTVVLASGATAGDIIDLVAYGAFNLANTYTQTAADNKFLQVTNNLSDLNDAATARTNLGLAIGTDVQAYDATILKSADIGVSVQAYDATILKSADIGVSVQAYDASTAKLGVAQTFTANQTVTAEFKATSYNESYSALSGTTPTVDCEAGNVFSLTTSGNTTFTFINPPATGTAFGFTLKVTAGGTHTLTWPASVDWAGGTAPDAPASGETNVLVFITHDGGTTWYGFQAGAALA